MILAEPVQITYQIAQELDRLNIPYFVGGSLASSLHGVPRATQGVDIVIDIRINNIPKFVKAFEAEFYIDSDMIRDAIQHRSSFNIIHLANVATRAPRHQVFFIFFRSSSLPLFLASFFS